MKNKPKAIVLLSGGIDSATVLYYALRKGFEVLCLVFDYGQRHGKEIRCAKRIAAACGCRVALIKVPFVSNSSLLLEKKSRLPGGNGPGRGIPDTYVPARNIVFLSFALSYAEAVGAQSIFIGAHAQDYSGYPDCRPEFYRAFQKAASCGTKAGAGGRPVKICTPLVNMGKSQIIELAVKLGVPIGLTWSCYKGGKRPCMKCESCYYRNKGFRELGLKDPLNIKA